MQKKSQKNDNNKRTQIDFIDIKPHLFVKTKEQKGEEKFQFTDALMEYTYLLKDEDFHKAKRLCDSHSIKLEDREQFILDLS